MQVFIYETCSAGLPETQSSFPGANTTVFQGYNTNLEIFNHALQEFSPMDHPEGLIIARSEVIPGTGDVYGLIKKIVPDRSKPAVIYLARYLDRCDQTRWLFKIESTSIYGGFSNKYDVFESFNPTGTDVLYLTPRAVEVLLADFPIIEGISSERFLNTRVVNGNIKAYSTSPNIFNYNLTKCMQYSENFSKTVICSLPAHSVDNNYPTLLTQNVTVFWIFVVIFIAGLSIIFYRFLHRKAVGL